MRVKWGLSPPPPPSVILEHSWLMLVMQAANSSVNIFDILETKMDGVLPEKVSALRQNTTLGCKDSWAQKQCTGCLSWRGVGVFVQSWLEVEVPVRQVVCAGHSLGAALASICSVWASVQYPSADVLSATIGQVRDPTPSALERSLCCSGLPV